MASRTSSSSSITSILYMGIQAFRLSGGQAFRVGGAGRWEDDDEVGADSFLPDLADDAFVGVDDAFDDGQAEAHALGAGGEEGREEARAVLLGDAGAGVDDLDADRFRVPRAGEADLGIALALGGAPGAGDDADGAAFRHVVDGVLQELRDGAAHLAAVQGHGEEAGRGLYVDGYGTALGETLADGGPDQLVEVGGLAVEVGGEQEVAELVEDLFQ